MPQPQTLSTQQLEAYKARIDNAGGLTQQKAAAIAVYQELYDQGYTYAGWALGVASGSTLTAKVEIANQDKGFVRPGQPVRVKMEAFPFTRHGTLDATVAVLGADAQIDSRTGQATFPAYLALASNSLKVEGRPVAVTPGMNLMAEIKTGRRRVIDYLLSPVQAALDESLRER